MQKRVFHIDQECYIIYAEDLSSKKERFLRVGNSDFLKDFGESLTFMTLVSPLYPGNPFKEIDIFRPNIDRKIIGLKSVVEIFLDFLKTGGINTKKVDSIFAEDQSTKDGLTKKKEKITEEEFLKNIKPDSKMVKHSFASFYSDGNIRIFNKKELIFDLKDRLSKTITENYEISLLADYYLKYYKNSYEKSGIIHSGGSVFIFSQNNFACISDSQSWIKDSIRVGINPSNIDFLYITENIEPDSLWIKSFIKKRTNNKRIRLVLKENNPFWIKILPDELFLPVYPEKDSIELEIGSIKLFFQNKRINIISENIKMNFNGEKGFLDKGKIINGEMVSHIEKQKFNIIIDDYKEDSLTLFSYNPMIFSKILNSPSYIYDFFDNIKNFDADEYSFPVLANDVNYENNITPDENEKDDFYTKLFFENFRRIFMENNPEINMNNFLKFKNYLADLNGELINSNKMIIEQIFGIDPSTGRLGIRNTISDNEFFSINNDISPYDAFMKEKDIPEWSQKLESFKNEKENMLNAHYIDRINNTRIVKNAEDRFTDIINLKSFFLKEREELKKFIKEVEKKEILEEKQKKEKEMRESLKAKSKVEKEPIIPNEDYSAKEILEFSESNTEKHKKSFDPEINMKKMFILISAIILLALIIFGLIFFIPKIKINASFNKTTTQEQFLDDMKIKFDSEKDKPEKKSYYYNFYMTTIDKWKLTNIVAVKSGYSRMLFPFEKRYSNERDPDWIFPGNVLIMPDDTKIKVVNGDTMWGICETYLINEINNHEIRIRALVEKTKTRDITIPAAKKQLEIINIESHSEMVTNFINVLLIQDNFEGFEPKNPEKINK